MSTKGEYGWCATAKHSLFLSQSNKQTAYSRDQGNQTPNNFMGAQYYPKRAGVAAGI